MSFLMLRIRYFSDTFFNFYNMQQCSHYFLSWKWRLFNLI